MIKSLMVVVLMLFSFSVNALQVEAYKDGNVKAIFLGQSAAYDSLMSVIVNGTQEPMYQTVANHGTALNTEFNFGNISKGDSVVFKLDVLTTGETWYSVPSMNRDGLQHFHIVDIQGGLFVGAEDLYNNGDMDFNDNMVAFSNMMLVPEPETYAMFLVGLGLVSLSVRHRRRDDGGGSDDNDCGGGGGFIGDGGSASDCWEG